MTDRIHGFIVVLNAETRVDDAEPIKKAIEQLRGVIMVDVIPTNPGDFAVEWRVREELYRKIYSIVTGHTGTPMP